MDDTSQKLMNAFDGRVERRNERREFFRTAIAAGAVATAGAATLGWASRSDAATITDNDILNFALNLEYLEAQFYSHAAFGSGLPSSMLSGTGTQGQAIGGRQVSFSNPLVAQYAREIAQDEINHVAFLRSALGSAAIAQPRIDISTSATSAFSKAAQAAGVIGAGQRFDVYANDVNFLLGAFIFEDVGVTAYKGAAPLITNATYLEAAAGILAVEAYHASIVRTTLYAMGDESVYKATEAISNARDMLDGAPADNDLIGVGADDDQGITPIGSGTATMSNVAPLNKYGLAYSRTVQQVHNIVYLTPMAATMGGFFPNGTNGNAALTVSGDSSTY